MRTPRSRTTRATPLTSLAGCTRAQSGSKCPETAPATRIRSATCAAVELAVEPLGLGLRPGDVEHAAAHDVGVDALAGGHVDDLVHGGAHGRAEPLDAVLARLVGVRRRAARQLAGQPAAVASRRAEAGELGLDDPDVEGGVGLVRGSRRSRARSGRPPTIATSQGRRPSSRSVGAGSPTCCHQNETPPLRTRSLWPRLRTLRRFDPRAWSAVLLLVATPAASALSGGGCRSGRHPS